jgi:GAF domain-containing protein
MQSPSTGPLKPLNELVPEPSGAATLAGAAADGQGTAAGPTFEEVTASIDDLQELLLETEGVEEFLQGLTALAARLVSSAASCGMTVEPNGKPLTVACNSDVAAQVDELQYLLGEGPCLTALADKTVVHVGDVAAETRWPGFTKLAGAYEIRSCLALPLFAGAKMIGALTLYSPHQQAFGTAETERIEHFARSASRSLAVAVRLASYSALVDQLRASLATRAVIDQALGVIMAQNRCNQAEAFAVLRGASQRRNIKLRQLAEEVVANVSGQRPQPPPFGT